MGLLRPTDSRSGSIHERMNIPFVFAGILLFGFGVMSYAGSGKFLPSATYHEQWVHRSSGRVVSSRNLSGSDEIETRVIAGYVIGGIGLCLIVAGVANKRVTMPRPSAQEYAFECIEPKRVSRWDSLARLLTGGLVVGIIAWAAWTIWATANPVQAREIKTDLRWPSW